MNLVIKELKIKYKSSMLGFFWSLLRPALLILIYTFVFSVLFKADRLPNYPLFLMSGLMPWLFFAQSITVSTSSIIGNAGLIKKIYFPRELFPLSMILANGFSFLIEMLLLAFLLTMFGYRYYAYLPVVMLAMILQLLLIVGFSLFLSAVTVRFRDMKQMIEIVLRMWFYLTPIIYEMSKFDKAPAYAQAILRLNPMGSIVMLYKLPLYYNKTPGAIMFIAAITETAIIFTVGTLVFNRLSPSFAKEI